jgi:large subunit ribosomal protein L6
MSRIGRLPIGLPEGVTAEVKAGEVVITGPKGSLSRKIPVRVEVEIKDNILTVSSKSKTKQGAATFGTTRAHLANMVLGVSQGWKKELELVGTGYRAEVAGSSLVLTVGYSHPVTIEAPEGVAFKVEKSMITIEGVDKEAVGETAARVRAVRPPEPYKGKGIKYIDEVIRRKAGKAAKTVGAPA